jgi:hypothetical protein
MDNIVYMAMKSELTCTGGYAGCRLSINRRSALEFNLTWGYRMIKENNIELYGESGAVYWVLMNCFCRKKNRGKRLLNTIL